MRKQFALALGLILFALTSCAYAVQKEDTKTPPEKHAARSSPGQRFSEPSPPWALTASKSRRWMAQRKP